MKGELTAMRRMLQSCRAEQSRAEQSRAEQSRAEQSRAEQSRAEQSRAEHGLIAAFFRMKLYMMMVSRRT